MGNKHSLPDGCCSWRTARRQGKAGVAIAIRKWHTSSGFCVEVDIPRDLRGFVVHIIQGPPGCALSTHIIGVYLPCGDDSQTTRAAAYAYVNCVASQCRASHQPLYVCGDMNAAFYDTDRPDNLNAADVAYKTAVLGAGLQPLYDLSRAGNRPTTWHRCAAYTAGDCPTLGHRIDDILVLDCMTAHRAAAEVLTPEHRGNSDHEPLLATLPADMGGLCLAHATPAPIAGSQARRLMTPIDATELAKCKQLLDVELAASYADVLLEAKQLAGICGTATTLAFFVKA